MWIFLNDAFFSIVDKDCANTEVMVRARRAGDIKKVFGVSEVRSTDSDYLFRAAVKREDVEEVFARELARVKYANFKDSIADPELHLAAMKVWSAMAATQHPPPYSTRYKGRRGRR